MGCPVLSCGEEYGTCRVPCAGHTKTRQDTTTRGTRKEIQSQSLFITSRRFLVPGTNSRGVTNEQGDSMLSVPSPVSCSVLSCPVISVPYTKYPDFWCRRRVAVALW